MPLYRYTVIVILSGITVLPVKSQNDSIDYLYAVTDTLDDDIILFDKDDPLEITLAFDITQYRKNRQKNEYLDAILTYHISATDSVIRELKVRPRGISRRSICNFPPLLLNFRKQNSPGEEFSSINKIKMVTHCIAGGDEYLLKEFLVYKLYNILTDYSFRVRILRVTYINTHKKSKPIQQFAFVIEPDKTLIERVNSGEEATSYMTQKHIRPEVMDRMAIFNYMTGNTDWSVPIRHNVLVLTGDNPYVLGSGVVVPYDFDYAGFVNTHYAVPTEGLGLKSVIERRYLGVCRSEEIFSDALKEFSEKKEEFYKTINEFPYINAKSKKKMIGYLETFYKGFNKRNTIVNIFRGECIDF